MSKYSSILYDQAYYGQKSRLAFSVNPFTATSLDYSLIQLNWSAPLGGYTAFRILRNQEGYSATVEDGITIFEEFNIDPSGAVSISTFTDGKDNPNDPPLTGGKFAYYRAWILKSSDNVWYPAGDTYTVVPSEHPTFGPKLPHKHTREVLQTTHDKVMNLLPRMYTSETFSPIDEVNPDSDLYRFLKGISFTMDEFLTMADSLLPDYNGHRTNPAVIPAAAYSLGLTQEPYISINSQKRMLRDAIYMYSHKGSTTGLATMVEALTGYGTQLSVSPNLMLSNQDATFLEGLGYWIPVGNCTLTLENVNPVTAESLSIDSEYSAKVVVGTGGASISNGADYPVTRGIPVSASTTYGFSFYLQKSTGTGTVTPSITWYDYQGNVLSTTTGTSVTATTTWAKPSTLFTGLAPDGAVYASVALKFNATGTYYVDMVQFAISTELNYNESRAAYVFLEPTKNNFILNPSFEVDVAQWTVNSGTVSRVSTDVPPQDLTGGHAMQIASGTASVTTSSTKGVFTSDSYATVSAYLRSVEASSESVHITLAAREVTPAFGYTIASNVLTVNIEYNTNIQTGDTVVIAGIGTGFNGTYTVIDATPGSVSVALTHTDVAYTAATATVSKTISVTETVSINQTWERQSLTIYVPANVNSSNTILDVTFAGTFTGHIQLDAVQLEPKFKPTDYFDGDYGTERDALWAGTANESNSYLYANKIMNVTRLAAELPAYLPQNTAYVISSYSGIEASGFTD